MSQSKAPTLPDGSVRTTYEQMITFGVEYGPYVRLAETFGDMIAGRDVSGPRPATFHDGVAQMAVLEAIMESSAHAGRWTPVEATEHAGPRRS